VPTWSDLSLPFVRADIQIDIPRNVWLQGPSTAIELSGNMRVTKDLYAPFILSGSTETVRGYASYYGKRFTVESGHVTFTGTPELNPMLDVTVTQTVSDYLVSIHVTGRAQQPTIAFSSTPELPETDILVSVNSFLDTFRPKMRLHQPRHTVAPVSPGQGLCSHADQSARSHCIGAETYAAPGGVLPRY
jgi:hypothetical protein